jgi:hypothetical protein
MSIEKTITDLTNAVIALTVVLQNKQSTAPAAPAQQPAAPMVALAPAPAMPPPPAFVMPTAAPAPVAPTVPFNDAKSLLNYVMESYKTLGPAKGANIQGVLTSLGVANINEVTPDKYAALFAGVEQLKAA